MYKSILILAAALFSSGLQAEPAKDMNKAKCSCQNCVCTPANHCGCHTESTCCAATLPAETLQITQADPQEEEVAQAE